MKLVVALLGGITTLAVGGAARAEAPGEVEPVICAAPAGESVMAHRWAVGLALGSEALVATSAPAGTDPTQFAVGELALRYRATLHLELEAAIGGGREQLPNGGGPGDRELTSATLSARYRFRPERAWNWYVSGGLGATAVASQSATDDERRDAQRAHFQVGIGLERRFHHLALSAELRAIGVAADSSSTDVMPQSTVVHPTPAPADGQSGGTLILGASYYF